MDDAILEIQHAIDCLEAARRYGHNEEELRAAIADGLVLSLKRHLFTLQQEARR